MSDAYTYTESTGIITTDTSTIQSDVETEFKDALGSDISTETTTPEGRLIDAETTARAAVAAACAEVANQINPNYAEGVWLDAIYALMGGERTRESFSTVTCTLSGVEDTVIPSGSLVEDDDGNQWELIDETTIDSSLSVDANFQCTTGGSISADAGTITTIISAVVGWETVTNAAAATPGDDEQSDVSTRYQRKVEIGQNAKANSYAVIAAVSVVDGVESVIFRENYEEDEQVIDGVSIAGHSSYLCVDGGVDSEIVEAYYTSKSGCGGFTGDESATYTDPNSGQEITVLFDRPDEVPVYLKITASVTSSSDAIDDIKSAAVAYANGEVDGYDGFVLGEAVSPFEIASAINSQMSDVFIRLVTAKTTGSYTTSTIDLEIFEKGTLTADNIEVTIA